MRTATVFAVLAVVGLTSATLGTPSFTNTVDVYTVLDGRLPSPPSAVWTHDFDGSVSPMTSATLTIVAEGVDVGEQDPVYFEGHFLGYLQDQRFYNSGFEIQPGPGALGHPYTELSTTVFSLDPSWIQALTSASVQVDNNWIMEVETSTLTIIPEPATLSLLALGGLAFLRRRR